MVAMPPYCLKLHSVHQMMGFARQHLGIDLGGGKFGMAQQALHQAYVATLKQAIHRKAVAESVGGQAFDGQRVRRVVQRLFNFLQLVMHLLPVQGKHWLALARLSGL